MKFQGYPKHLLIAALLSVASALMPAQAEPGVSSDSITLGQSTALSGPLADLGQEILKGAKAYFDSVNAKGGVNGRKIKIVTKDDAYDPKKTIENIEGFVSENNVLAFFGTFGTPNNEALIPVAQKAGIPVFMPYTGSSTVRGKSTKGVFNLRASYPDEADKLVENLVTIGIKKIAIAYQNNSFGKEVLNATTEALKKRNLTPVATASVENNASNAGTATNELLKAAPDAILLGLAGKPTIEVIKLVNTLRKGTRLYALSVLATPGNLRTLGNDGTGVAISQVMPFPRSSTIALVREYQQAMTAAGHSELSHISLEGYVNAKVMTEVLKRAGKQPTRSNLVSVIESMRKYDLGGLDVTFGDGASSGSRFVELTMINSQGKLIK
jgi:branched-chain amino acid transport system substrate-binding protein